MSPGSSLAASRHFSSLPNRRRRGSIPAPTQSRAELQIRRRQWDTTSKVSQIIKNRVHGALHWWALSKAAKPHFLKRYWRAPAPSRGPAASMPEPRSAMPAPRPAVTRWASASPPPRRISWATVTPSLIVRARWSSPTTCAPRFRRSTPRWWSARPTNASCRSFSSLCASSKISAFPRFLFLNKIDRANKRIRETLATLQPASRIPLVLRQIPIWNGDLIAGFVDLALERAFVYREHKASEVVSLEGGDLDREKEGRWSMLEKLADYDGRADGAIPRGSFRRPRDAVFDRSRSRTARSAGSASVLLAFRDARERRDAASAKALPHDAQPVLLRPPIASCVEPRLSDATGLCVQDPGFAARRHPVSDAAAGQTSR